MAEDFTFLIARRRVALALGSCALATRPLFAQPQARIPRIGFLTLDSESSRAGQFALEQFPTAMAGLGYRAGNGLVMEWRFANGKTEDLPNLAAGLARTNVDVIVARNNDPIRAAMAATRSIPIVMLNGNFPVETGLVESLGRPGGNVTGTAYVSPQTIYKQLQVLKEIVPRARRVAILWAVSDNGYVQVIRGSLDRAAAGVGLALQYFDVRRPDHIPPVMEQIAASKCDALWFSGSAILRTRFEEIIEALRRQRLPSVGSVPLFAEQGGLAHYAPDIQEFFERTAGYVDRILKGARPADLPIHQPTKYELVVNMRTAKALGITIPQAVLNRADRLVGNG